MKVKTLKNVRTRKEKIYSLSVSAYLAAFALILMLAESYLPPLVSAAPGAKFGLGNIAIMVAFVAMGFRCAFVVLIVKICVGSIFLGNLFALVYSLPAGIISFLVFAILARTCHRFLNLAVISVIAALVHNIVQVLVASLFVKNILIVTVLPWLAIISVVAGIVTALCAKFILIKVFKGERKYAL